MNPKGEKKRIIQFVKFGIVGLSNTFIGYIIYLATLWMMRYFRLCSAFDLYIAQFVMFVISVAWSFFWNERIVFNMKDGKRGNMVWALIKTYISYAFTSLFLSEALLAVWVRGLGINAYIAPIINLIITVPLNFVLQKYWVFGGRENAF